MSNVNLDKLQIVMRERGINSAQLAKEARIDKATVSLLLSGKRTGMSANTLVSIARALKVNPSELMN